MVKVIQSSDFIKEVLSDKGVVLVDFYADWCGPCKMIAPVLNQLDTEMGEGVKIRKVNVETSRDIALNYGIMSIPTIVVFKDGKKVDSIIGLQPKEALKAKVEKWM